METKAKRRTEKIFCWNWKRAHSLSSSGEVLWLPRFAAYFETEKCLNIWHHKVGIFVVSATCVRFWEVLTCVTGVFHICQGPHSHVQDVPKVRKAIKSQTPTPLKAQARPWFHIVRIQSYGTILILKFVKFIVMTQSQMFQKVESDLPAKFWRLTGCTKIGSR